MPKGAAAETHARPSMQPFYGFASSETGSLCVHVHRLVVGAEAGTGVEDLPDAVARLAQLDPELGTRWAALAALRLATVDAAVAQGFLDSASAAAQTNGRWRVRIARARAHLARAMKADGLAPLRDAIGWVEQTEDPVGTRHALAHALADYAAFAEDTEAARLALKTVDGIGSDDGHDDVKGRVVRRLAMKNDIDPTTHELLSVAAESDMDWDDPWEEAFTAVQLGLGYALLGDEAEASRRWTGIERRFPSRAPLGPVGAVILGGLFRARAQAGRTEEASRMVRGLEAEFRAATHDFAGALMETDGRDQERIDEATLNAMDDGLTRMIAVLGSLILGGWFGHERSYLRSAQRLMDSLPSPHPIAGSWLSLAQAWHAAGQERLAKDAWRTALLARGHEARTVGDALREIVEAEVAMGMDAGDQRLVDAAAERLRKARGQAEDRDRLMGHILEIDLQTRLEAADGVTYFYD